MDAPVLIAPLDGELAIGPASWGCWVSDLERIFQLNFATNTAWGTANKALFFAFSLHTFRTFKKISWINGATVNGNVDFGIYDRWGNLLGSLGSTVQSGTSTIQIGDMTDLTLAPNLYFFGMASSSATATFLGSPTAGVPVLSAYGVQTMASAFPLPSTATFTNLAANQVVPWFMFNSLANV